MLGSLAPALVSAAVAASLAGYAAWSYQAARYEAELSDMRLAAAQAIRKTEERYATHIRAAEDRAAARARALRVDADRARLVADGLRHDLARAVRAAESSPAACADGANALADVLLDMERAGRGMAETCDRIAVDRDALLQAWPR